jgi:hypothetical protein
MATSNLGAREARILGSGLADGHRFLRGDLVWTVPTVEITGAEAIRTTTQTVNTNTDTPVQWATVDYDNGSFFDLGTDNTKMFISTAGIYLVSCYISLNTSGGTHVLYLQKDGSFSVPSYADTAFVTHGNVSGLFYFSASGYIKCIFNSSAGDDIGSATGGICRIL